MRLALDTDELDAKRLESLRAFAQELEHSQARIWMHCYHSAYLKESVWASPAVVSAIRRGIIQEISQLIDKGRAK